MCAIERLKNVTAFMSCSPETNSPKPNASPANGTKRIRDNPNTHHVEESMTRTNILVRTLVGFFAVLVVVYFGAETYSINSTSGHQTVSQKLLYKSWNAPNDVIATNWLRRAAQHGDAMVQHDMGLRYHTGTGVPQNDEEATRWTRMAADQGLLRAQVFLGNAHLTGRGVSQDEQEALRWFRMAAQNGSSGAKVALGKLHKAGIVLPQSDAEAMRLFQDAKDHAYYNRDKCESLYQLGVMYLEGRGVDTNIRKAVRLFRSSANEDGCGKAQRVLNTLSFAML